MHYNVKFRNERRSGGDNDALTIDLNGNKNLTELEKYGTYIFPIKGEITSETFDKFQYYMYNLTNLYQDVDPRKLPEVIINIDSVGGDLIAASGIIDIINISPFSIITYVSTMAMSAAAFIHIAGHRRVASPSSIIMLHDFKTMEFGKHSEIEAASKWNITLKHNFSKMLTESTRLPKKEIDDIFKGIDYYYTPEESLEKGITDIIGIYTGIKSDFVSLYYWDDEDNTIVDIQAEYEKALKEAEEEEEEKTTKKSKSKKGSDKKDEK